MGELYIGLEIRKVSNQIYRKLNELVYEGKDVPTAHQVTVLNYLVSHNGHTVHQKDIEEHFNIRRSTANHMLQLMEKNGYLKRVPSETDSRVKCLILTDRGIASQKYMTQQRIQFEEMMLKGVTEEELQVFLKTLHQIQHNVE